MKRLGVNIDHIATIRNARGEHHPDPFFAAKFVKKSGANSITIHLREDRRHINDLDAKKVIVINDAHMEELYIGEYILSENIAIPSKPDFSILKEDIGELALAVTKDFFCFCYDRDPINAS